MRLDKMGSPARSRLDLSGDRIDLSECTTIYDGSYATLLRGGRRADGTPIVVKRLRSDFPSAIDLARLHHEHAILRSLSLPGVVRTFGLVATDNGLGLLLEDIGERSIRTIVQGGRPPLGRFLELACAMTKVVDSIHRERILHKDIKPDHFFFDSNGVCKLIDFGIATRLSREAQPGGAAAHIEGTFAYISPEQTGRMNRVVDQRSDLYSLGVTLYELLTGALPFTGADPLALTHSHVARTPVAPEELVPGIPAAVSAIVMKLLAKMAEDRYQSASGLLADLESCAAQLEARGIIEPFRLGRRDRSGVLRIPQRLYGRDAELAALIGSFERARAGAAELLLIRGPSGTGKSSVVNELHKQLVLKGSFVGGKFDQLNRAVPYAPIIGACRDLVRSVLARPSGELAAWADRLRGAVGPSGRIIAELVPELELVIGEQPPPVDVGPGESQKRFELIFRRFVQVFAAADHPLVLFLDDLQWADAASLRLLGVLLTSAERGHLLVLGAYRDAEIGPGHALTDLLTELHASGAPVHSITLGALGQPDVRRLFADALSSTEEHVAPLADLALRLTLGNPFFLGQFLTTLSDQGLLAYDAAAGAWTWQLDRIDEVMVTASVADLLIDRIHRLQPTAQEALKVAACIGHRFDLETLATAMNRTSASVASDVWELLSEGLLVPLDERYQYVHDAGELELNPSYRFLHDRVQQAAYALIEPERRAAVRLQMGRLLVARSGETPPDELLFEIVNHMNVGSSLLVDAAERRMLARLDLRAGLRARDSAANEAALGFLRHGLTLLGDDPWQTDHEIAYQAHCAVADCEEVLGRFEAAFATIEVIDRRARSVEQRAAAGAVKSRLYTKTNRMVDACAAGVQAAALLGLDMPTDPDALMAANHELLGRLQPLLAGREEALADLPAMTDPHALALANVLATMIPPAFMANQQLYVHAVLQTIAQSLRSGNAPGAPQAYLGYGVISRMVTGDRAIGYRLGRIGVALAQQPPYRASASVAHLIFGMFLSHGQAHLSESLDHLRRAIRAGFENGDHVTAAYCAAMVPVLRFCAGDELEDVREEIEATRGLLKTVADRTNEALLASLTRIIDELGYTGQPSTDGGAEAAAYSSTLASNPFLLGIHLSLSLVPPSIAGDTAAVLAGAAALEPVVPFIANMFLAVDHVFHRALARARMLGAAEGDERAALCRELDADQEILAENAAGAPDNHAHRGALVAAVRAAASGEPELAMRSFDEAIGLAREHGFRHHEALASELCGQYHLDHGRTRIARMYLGDAYHGYLRWGARTRTAHLAARFPDLFAGPSGPLDARATTTTSSLTSSIGLDVASAMRMMRAIASELVLDKLVECLMRSVVENAAAQRGFLVVPREDRLVVSAAVSVEPDQVRIGLAEDLETSQDLATAVVHYVARSRDPVVLADAVRDDRFRGDRYVARARPRSILCVPMVHQGRLSGVMYLENDAATNVFDPTRVELIQFLAAQAAIAIENATLYQELERRVAERTAALAAANQSLKVSLEELGLAQRRLIDISRLAGRADVATSILHNVGNVLTSVNVSVGEIKSAVDQSKSGNLRRVAGLLAEHREDLARFLGEDPRGKQLPEYLDMLAEVVDGERAMITQELKSLGDNIDHIKVVVAMQQSNARMGGLLETVAVTDLLDEAIRINLLSAPRGQAVELVRDYADVPAATMDRHKVLQIVLNLLSNARAAVSEAGESVDRQIRLHCGALDGLIVIRVEDDGVGIPAENLDRVFNFGFTTKEQGHGFGLHSCANAAAEIGGTLTCESGGVGRGATFTLAFPLVPAGAPRSAATPD